MNIEHVISDNCNLFYLLLSSKVVRMIRIYKSKEKKQKEIRPPLLVKQKDFLLFLPASALFIYFRL